MKLSRRSRLRKVSTPLRKINFGCGYDKRDGYLNVDVDPACKPDLLIKRDDYSVIPSESFDEVLAQDVLEHIPRAETAGVIFDWAGYLVTGGTLTVQTSSILGVARQLEAAPDFATQHGWSNCLFGNQTHRGDFHYTGFTETTLRVHLLAAGFEVHDFSLDDGWLLGVTATKTWSWNELLDEQRNSSDTDFIRTIYQVALQREPDGNGKQYLTTGLKRRRLTRSAAARHLFGCPERLFRVAELHGL